VENFTVTHTSCGLFTNIKHGCGGSCKHSSLMGQSIIDEEKSSLRVGRLQSYSEISGQVGIYFQ